jgi:hypothetical protein
MLVDQSRHRAARVDERHQKWTAEVAAMAFRCAIGGARYAKLQRRVKHLRYLANSVDDPKSSMHCPFRCAERV